VGLAGLTNLFHMTAGDGFPRARPRLAGLDHRAEAWASDACMLAERALRNLQAPGNGTQAARSCT